MRRLTRGWLSPASLLLAILAGCGSSGSSTAPVSTPPESTEPATFIITGRVKGASDVTKVTLTLTPGGTTVHPAASGTYEFTGLAKGTYTVTPALGGYTFNPASLSATVDAFDVAGGDFVMTSASATGPNTPDIPLPTSATDELPARSKELVTDVAPVQDFSPYVDPAAVHTACPSFKGGNVALTSSGASVAPALPYTYSCQCHDCNCNWFGFDCDTCCNTCTGSCSGPVLSNPPFLRRTVYWKKVFQTLVGPGASYTQAMSVTSGSSKTDAETLATTMGVQASVGLKIFSWLSASISATFSRTSSQTHSVTVSESQTVAQTFSCPSSSATASRLFVVWQLHERFDFSDATGRSQWVDPVYHPVADGSLPSLENALSLFYESTTVF